MASIRERESKSGERTWAVLFRHGTRQASKTFATPKAAAGFKTLVENYGADRALKMLTDHEEAGGITVAELAEKYLEWKGRDVTDRTLTDYRRDVTNWILPWLGHKSAEQVDESDVQGWVDHMRTRLAPKSVADRHMLLHSMYDFGRAKSRRLVTHNPCLETELPARAKRTKRKGTTVPEFRALLASAAHRNPDAHDLILYLGETGWRWSEGAPLDVRDVEDYEDGVWVDMTRVFRLDKHGRQFIAEGEAKSEAGFRRIRMFPETTAMLRRRLVGKRPGDLVFTNSRGRPWNQNTFLRETWPRIEADAGLDRHVTPHMLRHMHVAVLAASGVPMHEIQRRIGHEHYSTTVDVYGSMIGDIGDDALARAGEIMAGRRSAPTIAPGNIVIGELVP
jgi:integrase